VRVAALFCHATPPGPDVEFRRTDFEPDLGAFPDESPSASRAEATEFFERSAV
jgi:hypothetical protein